MIGAQRIPFGEEDERRIASAATWGLIVATTSMAGSVLMLVMQAETLVALPQLLEVVGVAALLPLLQPIVTVLLNVALLQASLAFRKVALTDEADQAHLLGGFRKLRAYFMIQVIMILLILAAVLIGMVLGFS